MPKKQRTKKCSQHTSNTTRSTIVTLATGAGVAAVTYATRYMGGGAASIMARLATGRVVYGMRTPDSLSGNNTWTPAQSYFNHAPFDSDVASDGSSAVESSVTYPYVNYTGKNDVTCSPNVYNWGNSQITMQSGITYAVIVNSATKGDESKPYVHATETMPNGTTVKFADGDFKLNKQPPTYAWDIHGDGLHTFTAIVESPDHAVGISATCEVDVIPAPSSVTVSANLSAIPVFGYATLVAADPTGFVQPGTGVDGVSMAWQYTAPNGSVVYAPYTIFDGVTRFDVPFSGSLSNFNASALQGVLSVNGHKVPMKLENPVYDVVASLTPMQYLLSLSTSVYGYVSLVSVSFSSTVIGSALSLAVRGCNLPWSSRTNLATAAWGVSGFGMLAQLILDSFFASPPIPDALFGIKYRLSTFEQDYTGELGVGYGPGFSASSFLLDSVCIIVAAVGLGGVLTTLPYGGAVNPCDPSSFKTNRNNNRHNIYFALFCSAVGTMGAGKMVAMPGYAGVIGAPINMGCAAITCLLLSFRMTVLRRALLASESEDGASEDIERGLIVLEGDVSKSKCGRGCRNWLFGKTRAEHARAQLSDEDHDEGHGESRAPYQQLADPVAAVVEEPVIARRVPGPGAGKGGGGDHT